ncbi:PP2C family protein-serine/threonine phosphatase [Acrocarpospora catenulata]|uniref:PP2C family protein-serine/threonine phosphatase n=1 Tax=Acrocarpospora catenulata TaxID=2836182 RepID=UPI001BDB516F|nr:PP2C family protein-serine/threonine phosphatase [Acrocarpospora catenulata]
MRAPLAPLTTTHLTTPQTAAEMVADLRARLDRQEEQLAAERGLSTALRAAILPEPGAILDLPSANIAVRYVPAGQSGLGGDWYEATPLADGRVLLAVGDVSGHGIAAIAQMAQLRHALVGLAMTRQPPDRLLSWLNRLVLNCLDDTIATVITGLFTPRTGLFRWAQAGHLAPILVRDGRASQPSTPAGLVLGAVPHPPFAVAELRLQPGDRLLLFTDGLVERRNRDIGEGLTLALRAAERLDWPDLEGPDLDALIDEVGGPNPDDDMCLLAVRLLGE